MRANERTNERVARYFSLYSWLFWPTLQRRYVTAYQDLSEYCSSIKERSTRKLIRASNLIHIETPIFICQAVLLFVTNTCVGKLQGDRIRIASRSLQFIYMCQYKCICFHRIYVAKNPGCFFTLSLFCSFIVRLNKTIVSWLMSEYRCLYLCDCAYIDKRQVVRLKALVTLLLKWPGSGSVSRHIQRIAFALCLSVDNSFLSNFLIISITEETNSNS